MFSRYYRAVMNYDGIVGKKCLNRDSGWAPDWTDEEVQAIKAMRQDFAGSEE